MKLNAYKRLLKEKTAIRQVEGMGEFVRERLNVETVPKAWILQPKLRASPGKPTQRVSEVHPVVIAHRFPADFRGERAAQQLDEILLAVIGSIDGWEPDPENNKPGQCPRRLQFISSEPYEIMQDGTLLYWLDFEREYTKRAYTWGEK